MRYTTTCTDVDYRELVEFQQDLIVKFSPEGRLLYMNPAYCEAVGKTQEELAGSVFMPVTSEKYAEAIATHMTKLFRPPFTCVFEQWIQTPKGMRCYSWSARSVVDENKNVVAIVATGRDLTTIKLSWRTIRKRDRELMLLLESGSALYYTHSPEQLISFASPRIRALLGCRPRAGKWAWTDYLTDNPVNAAGLERTIRALRSGRREPPYRLEMKGGDGRIIWVEVNEVPVVKDGKTVAIAGSITDITDRMCAEEGAAEAEILIRGVRPEEPESSGHSPFGFIKSIFSKQADEEEDDEFEFNIPKGLN